MRTPELSKVLVEDRGKRWKKLWNIEEGLQAAGPELKECSANLESCEKPKEL